MLRWDGRAIISHVDDNILLKCTLQHTENPSSAASLAQLRILGKHTAEELVREVAWSPDSQKLATLTEKAVRIWNVVVWLSILNPEATLLIFLIGWHS